jgi:beta-lactamase regulating signal transducer with metallopeptidase domain
MNALMTPFVAASAKGAAWMLVWSWQAAVLLACVWAGLKIFRVKSPALRHQVWLFALIAVVAMPALSGVVQKLPLPQPNYKALSYAVELPRIVVTNDAAPVVQNPSPSVRARPSIKRPIILSLSFALWLAGALILVTKAAINVVRLRRLKAGARRASLTDLECDECDCEALRAGKVSLAVSDDIRSPILLGVLRPMIAFPADIAAWTSPAERGAMLRHELAHVERRDHYVNFFQTILGAVFFFHPLARYACRQLAVEREIACDDHVIGSGAEAETYAESIIKAAERSITPIGALAGAPGGVRQLAFFSARHTLERRIEMILNRNRVRAIARPWRYLIAPAGLITFVVWLLIPVASVKSSLAQAQFGSVITPGLEVVENNVKQSVTFHNDGQQGSAKPPAARKASGDLEPGQTAPPHPAPSPVSTDAESVPKPGSSWSSWSSWSSSSVSTNAESVLRDDRDKGQMSEVYRLLSEVVTAYMTRKTSFFEIILADDYFGIDPKGVIYNKAQQIDDLKKLKSHSGMSLDVNLKASIDGNSAVGEAGCAIYPDSGEPAEEYRFTVTFVRREERWKVLSIQVNRKK